MSPPVPNMVAPPGGFSPFNPRLESLRGLAALTVALQHSFRAFPAGASQTPTGQIADHVFNGNAAVTLFFVLSGYVLGLGLRHAGPFNLGTWGTFSLRRVFRIYPMLLVSTGVIVVGLWCSAISGWPLPGWFGAADGYRPTVLHPGTPPGSGTILGNVLLWTPSLNIVTWTLGIELRCSLLLPLLHAWSTRLSGRGRCLLLLALIGAAGLPKWCLLAGAVAAEAKASLAHNAFSGYLFLFYLGYLLPDFAPRLRNAVDRLQHWAAILPWACLVMLLGADRFGDDRRILQGLAAAGLIGLLAGLPAARQVAALDAPLARFFGRISYSFYIWHDLVLIVLVRSVSHGLPGPALSEWAMAVGGATLLVSIAVTAGLASLTFRWIEEPCLRWSKALTRRPREKPEPPAMPGLPPAQAA